MSANWSGHYINLAGASERRTAMDAMLARAGLADRYRRFTAVTGAEKPAGCRLRPGEYGCFRSHHDALAELSADGRFIHVLEDDVVLADAFGPMMHLAIDNGMMEPFDIVFTDTLVANDLRFIRMLKGLYDRSARPGTPLSLSLIDLSGSNFSVMASYIVNPRKLDRVVACMRRGLAAGPTQPIDLHMRAESQAGRLKVGLLFPFLSTVRAGTPSTISEDNASATASILLRHAFFTQANVDESRRLMAGLLGGPQPGPPDPRLDLIGDVLRFVVSDRFQQF